MLSALLAIAAELGHMQWTSGGPSGVRSPIAFDAAGISTWRESGVSMSRGTISIWTAQRSVSKDSFYWGGGGAAFFGIDSELGGPPADQRAVRWIPHAGIETPVTPGPAPNRATFITLPLWPLAALLLLAAAIAYRKSLTNPHACPRCGYDLRGLRDRICPECGSGASASSGQ